MTEFTTWRSLVDGAEISAIRDSVVTQYEYEDESDTTVAVDSIGNNDATITGAAYTSSDAIVGDFSLRHDGTDDVTVSENTVDLVALGDADGFELSAYINLDGTSDSDGYLFAWSSSPDSDTQPGVGLQERDDSVRTILTVDGNNTIGNEVSVSLTDNIHASVQVTQSDITLYLNNIAEDTTSHSEDITNIGAQEYRTGHAGVSPEYANLIIDDFSAASEPLSDSERQSLVDRGN